MSSYSRNKYRCLLKPNVNVFHLDNNIPSPVLNPGPQPRFYPYPGYDYPGYNYPYPGNYLYPRYDYRYPYVEKDKPKSDKSKSDKPKNDKPKSKDVLKTSHCYYDSSSSSSSDDSYRYRRRYLSKSPQNEKVETVETVEPKNQFICEPDPCEFDPFKETKECDPISQRIFDVKNKNFAKPLAKLLTKFTENPQEIQESCLEEKTDGKKIYLK
jgi:hypothetical protein